MKHVDYPANELFAVRSFRARRPGEFGHQQTAIWCHPQHQEERWGRRRFTQRDLVLSGLIGSQLPVRRCRHVIAAHAMRPLVHRAKRPLGGNFGGVVGRSWANFGAMADARARASMYMGTSRRNGGVDFWAGRPARTAEAALCAQRGDFFIYCPSPLRLPAKMRLERSRAARPT